MNSRLRWPLAGICLAALLPWTAGCGASSTERPDAEAHHDGPSGRDVDGHGVEGGHGGQSGHDDDDGGHSNHATSDQAGGRQDGRSPTVEAPAAGNSRPAVLAADIKVKSGEGQELYTIKWKDDGAKLVDSDEQELARYNVSADGRKLKIKGAGDEVLGYLVGDRRSGRIKVEDASQERELFKLIRQDGGDWKLEDASDTLLVRIKLRDYGAELETPDDASLGKVKARDGKTSWRDPQDKTRFYTKSSVGPLSFACLALEAIEETRIRAALLVHMQAVHDSH